MIRKTLRVKDETGSWIEKGASERKIGEGEFIDLVATWPTPTQEGKEVIRPEKTVLVAEELELPNGLLKISRDEDGLPIGFVRAKSSDGWTPINWKKLEALNVEVQGLKRDKLAKEVEKLEIVNAKLKGRLNPSARHELEEGKDTAEGWLWCAEDAKVIQTFGEEDHCRRFNHKLRTATESEIRFAGLHA